MSFISLDNDGTQRPVTDYISGLAGATAERASNIQNAVARGLRVVEWEAPHDRRFVLACYGPSLADTWPSIARGGDLWTVSGANTYLFKRGMAALGHVEIDPRPHKADVLVGASPFTTYHIASRCAPQMFDAAPGPVRLFHLGVPDDEQFLPPARRVPTAVVCGLCALQLGYFLGYRDFDVHGMDCSYRTAADLAICALGQELPSCIYDTFQSHASSHPTGRREAQCVEVGGRRFLTDPLMLSAASDFFAVLAMMPGARVTLNGDGLLPTIERLARVR